MDKIIMKNMKFYGYHGVLPKEQEMGQYFFVDAELSVDTEKAGLSDNLEDTLDYSKAYEMIKDITENRRFRLIEALANTIAREILSGFNEISETKVKVRKPEAPIDGEFDYMGVEIVRSRNGL